MLMRTGLLICAVIVCSGVGTGAQMLQGVGVKEYVVGDDNVIQVQTRLRYVTMLILPDGDEIVDVVAGDAVNWDFTFADRIVHVMPRKEGAATNANVTTTSGAVYSFLFHETSGTPGTKSQPDLKVYAASSKPRREAPPKYVTVDKLGAVEAELASARKAVAAAVEQSTKAVAEHQKAYPTEMRFYDIKPKGDLFGVQSIWHDGQFTYIRSTARELPALYELQDGKPAIVNVTFENGLYVVPKVLVQGYLAAGKKRLEFVEMGQ